MNQDLIIIGAKKLCNHLLLEVVHSEHWDTLDNIKDKCFPTTSKQGMHQYLDYALSQDWVSTDTLNERTVVYLLSKYNM